MLLSPVMNLFAGEPNGKKFRAAVDRRSKSKEDGASFGALLLGAAEESLLAETLDAPPGVVWEKNTKSYVAAPRFDASAPPAEEQAPVSAVGAA